jgi:hypothetical protein
LLYAYRALVLQEFNTPFPKSLFLTDRVTILQLINRIVLAAFFLSLSAPVFAAQLTGTVTNGTTNKPSPGDEVVLLSLAGGMDEVGHAKTDAQGHFSINAPDQGQMLVRVDHQSVNYFKAAPQGTLLVDVTVYDAAKNIENMVGEGHVFRFQTVPGGQLEVQEMFILRNESAPPRTKMGYEFDLPAGAQVVEGMAEGPGGMPTNTAPVAMGQKNHYNFPFPMRPGRTRFQVTYKVPYAGTREFKLTPALSLAELGVMMPKSMQFNATAGNFSPAQDEAGMTVFVAKSLTANKEVKFSVSGEGTMPVEGQGGGGPSAGGQQQSGPGGGLGAPIEAIDPLSGSRWYIISIFVVVLGGGSYWLFRMQRGASHSSPAPDAQPQSVRTKSRDARQQTGAPARPMNGSNGSGVMEAVKEELFQLEADRLQGKLSQHEYETSKAGLESLMKRQLKKTEESRKK